MKDLENTNTSSTATSGKLEVSDSVFYNTNNLKVNDRFKSKGFSGEILITEVFESYFKVKMKDVSGNLYYATHTLVEFNEKLLNGEYYSLVRT